jgi:hypothetical protein
MTADSLQKKRKRKKILNYDLNDQEYIATAEEFNDDNSLCENFWFNSLDVVSDTVCCVTFFPAKW